jgi:hypothetical protein
VIEGSTLREMASFAGTNIDSPFEAGKDTPSIGDPDEALDLVPAHVQTIADWYALGWQVLDQAIESLPATAEPVTIQLWPEHFDVGTNVEVSAGARMNLGCSPGDSYEAAPYLYVGPWGEERPGDPEFWNAPFGAVLLASQFVTSADPLRAGLDFIRTGFRHVSRLGSPE